jgi:hypothetical protein
MIAFLRLLNGSMGFIRETQVPLEDSGPLRPACFWGDGPSKPQDAVGHWCIEIHTGQGEGLPPTGNGIGKAKRVGVLMRRVPESASKKRSCGCCAAAVPIVTRPDGRSIRRARIRNTQRNDSRRLPWWRSATNLDSSRGIADRVLT